MNKSIFWGAFALAISAISCNEFITEVDVSDNNDNHDNQINPDNKGFFISIEGVNNEKDKDPLSRNYWEEVENDSLIFRWENSGEEMKSFVFNDGSALNFVDGRKFTEVTVTAMDEEPNSCNMSLAKGLETEFKDGFVIWGVCPASEDEIVSDGNTVSATEVCFSMPETFIFNPEQESATEHLRDFLFMSGTGVVSNNKCTINFNVLPAILRFRIMNMDTETLNISSVSLSGPFNDKAKLSYDYSSENVGARTSYFASRSFHSITVSCNNGGVQILPGESEFIYSLVFPTDLSDDDITMGIESNYGDMEATTVYNNIFNNTGFKSNTYYTLSIPVSRRGINLDGTNVGDFTSGDTCTVNLDKINYR